MIPALPDHHPRLNGCLNQLTFTEVGLEIFDSWGPGSPSTFQTTVSFEFNQEDYEFVDRMSPGKGRRVNDLIIYLPLSVQEWINSSIQGSWLYMVKSTKTKDHQHVWSRSAQEFVFYFQKYEDMVLFKLSW